MAEERVEDAQTLMRGERWTFAYYAIGYAVECGLKSCVLTRMIHTGGVFADKNFSQKCWTHNFENLIELAGLKAQFQTARKDNPALEVYWGVVKDWKETIRYEQKTKAEAEALFEAITNEPDGVLPWVRIHW